MLDKSIYGFNDYKHYLAENLGRGQRLRLAEEIGVQAAFVSQVLKQKVHFSLEHGLKISRFLGHSDSEAHYFMLLLEFGRAGSEELREYFLQQLRAIQEKRLKVAERLQVRQKLSLEDQVIYYSSWYYGAIHVLLSIPRYQTKAALGDFLKLEASKVAHCLEFLTRCGLAQEKEDRFTIGATRIHIGDSSPFISKHHTNWRMRAIQAFESRRIDESLHFSGAITLSEADTIKIRKVLLDAIERMEKIYRPSPEEVAYVFNLDFFPL